MEAKTWSAWSLVCVVLAGFGCGRHAEAPFRIEPETPIVIISIDTLRSDRLPAYGHGGVETPAIDRFRSHGILFERAYTHVPLTLPAHASLLTGTLPADHGVRDNLGYTVDAGRAMLLQQRLSEAGYATGAAVSAFVLRRATGIAEGFDVFQDEIEVTTSMGLQGIQRSGDQTLESIRPWLRSAAARPFFLFFHIFEPHSPYDPPEPFASRYDDAYDGEVAAADAIVGDLLEELRSLGVYDRAMVFLLSDHGEGLGEHGEDEHGLLLYRTTLQVPLMVKLPNSERAGDTVARPVQLIDVYPTITSALRITGDEGLPGSSLIDAGDTDVGDRRIYSETFFPRLHCGWSDLASLIVGSNHYIDSPDPELFDLDSDPGELENLVTDRATLVEEFTETLAGFDRTLVAPGATDAETRRRLEALGYLGGASVSDDEDLPDPKTRVHVMRELRLAYRAMSGGDYDSAEMAFLEILEDNQGLEDAWEYLARAQREMGRPDRAVETLARGLEANPGSPRLSMGAATQFFEMGRLDDAAAHADLALTHDPAAAHELLARIALARRDLETAEAEAREAMSIEERRAGPRMVLADVHFAAGRPLEALKVLEAAVEEGIRDEAIRIRLAQVYIAAGQIDRAVGVMSGLEESSKPETMVMFGRLAGIGQQWSDARRWFERALQADPSNGEAKINLGVLAAVEGRLAEARHLLEEGLRADPGSFEGWNALGMIRARSGDADGAVDAWTRALEINPQSHDLLFNLGLAHAEAGRFARAAEYMESFAEVSDGEARERALGLAEQYRQRVRGFGLGIR
jgi:tetratricopeptide (TPR) repeat protein